MSVDAGGSLSLRALLFSDVENSTQLAERLGAAASAELWAAHDRQARDLLALHDGREVGRGDGVLVMFDDVAQAAGFAIDYQAATASLGLATRVGIHVGPVTLRNNAPQDVARGARPFEVDGLATPVTARLMALARGGQTLMSRDATNALAGRVPDGALIERHGFYRLKGIDNPIEIDEIGLPGARFEPPVDAAKAYRVTWNGDVWLPLAAARHTLPVDRDGFVGRHRELREIATRLASDVRLLTLQGAAGAGKTRVARRYAWTWLGEWPGGVYFCDLSEARSLDGILYAVATSLGVALSGGDVAEQVGRAISGRGRSLVILDNFEQLVDHAAATVGRWIDLAPQAAFLVTSRERLHLPGEAVLPIESLPIDPAIELFVLRARALDPSFEPVGSRRAAIADIVRLLDGLPLAIELAAARIRLFAPEQLLLRLRDRFGMLVQAKGVVPRQATLRAAIDWSWDLLAPWERQGLTQLSVFQGEFTVDAAEFVLDLRAWPHAPAAIDVIQALVDKSLVRAVLPSAQAGDAQGESMLAMFLSVQQYAAEKLDADGDERRGAERRHWTFYARLGARDAIAALSRRGAADKRREMARTCDNVIAACGRAIDARDGPAAVSTLAAAWAVLEKRGPFSAANAIGERVVAMPALPAADRLRALLLHAAILRRCGQPANGTSVARDALSLARHRSDSNSVASALVLLGALAADASRADEARMHVEEAYCIARELGDRELQGQALNFLGIFAAEKGRLQEARDCFASAWRLHSELGDLRSEAADIANLANLMRMQGDTAEAIAHFERALAAGREVGDLRVEGLATGNLGSLYRAVGRPADAQQQFERAIAIHRHVGNRHGEGVMLLELAVLYADLQALDASRHAFRDAERMLRAVGDDSGVVESLCEKARVELAAGDRVAADDALRAAEIIVEAAGEASMAEAGQRIAEVRALIETERGV